MTTLASNASAMMAARVLPPLAGFATNVGIARLLGVRDLGVFVGLMAVLAVFQAVAGAGMQFFLTREIAADPERIQVHLMRARSFAVVSGLTATAVFLVYAAFVLDHDSWWPGVLLSVTLLPSALIVVQESVFMALRVHHVVAMVTAIENTAKLVICLTVLAAGAGIGAVCGGIAVVRFVGLATGARFMRRLGIDGPWVLDSGAVAPFARAILPFAGLFVLSIVYFRIDIPIVFFIIGPEATGIYGAASALFAAVMLLPDAGLAAVYPRLVTASASSRDGYVKATWLVVKVLALIVTSIALVLMALAGPVIGMTYGPAFTESVDVLRVLALCLPIHAVNGALGQALQAGGEQRALMGLIVVSVTVHVLLNLMLVPAIGLLGAPVAMLLSSATVAIGAVRIAHQRVSAVRIDWRTLQRLVPFAGPLVMALLAPVGLRLYATVLALVWLVGGSIWHGTFDRDELASVRLALRPRPHGVQT